MKQPHRLSSARAYFRLAMKGGLTDIQREAYRKRAVALVRDHQSSREFTRRLKARDKEVQS